ncbi:helix-turn-helix domain-containing protein [Pseudonocardia sp. CA-107938]|uniref:helix-turn-helix domain-containing protein n=1 Tax=Pseudonocardia sp. CA-107938 TaxID=3240021 RepID=UPI003D909C42
MRRQLGAELQALRTLAGLTQRDLQDAIGLGQVAVSRIERGERLPTRDQVQAWVHRTAAAAEVVERVVALAEAAHGATTPWPDLDDAPHLQGVAGRREVAASLVRGWTTEFLPGLLQTAQYARQLFPLVDPYGSIDHAASVAARLERQQVLFEPGRRFEFLIAEHLLSWSPGPGVLPAQLDRIVSVATLETVEVRVLPSKRTGTPGWHSFAMFTAADDGAVFVTTELLHGGQELHDRDVVGLYERLWTSLWESALSERDSVELIRGLIG